jgi:soluble lytic murein transglycosylase
MFAMIRHESAFYPEAISQVGALGLFQIMPATFSELDRKWHLLKQGGAVSDVEYLLDPARNVALWARWWQAELSGDDLVVAVMKHSAGKGNVSKWTYWRQWGVEGDVEYRIETIRFPETRNFVRWVLQDTALLDAAGFFEPGT